MASVGYKNKVFDNVDGFFSAPIMLKSWKQHNQAKADLCCTNFGVAMNEWLQISKEKLNEIDKFILDINYQIELASDLVWRSEIYKDLKPNSPIYNVSEALNEYYYNTKNIHQHKIFKLPETEKVFIPLNDCVDRSQAMLSYWNTTRQCPTVKDYILCAQDYSTYSKYVDLMKTYSDKKEDFTKLLKYIATLVCLYKDHKGTVEELQSEDKIRIGEITKKIFTFPIVYAINDSKNEYQLKNLMRRHKHENGIKEYILTLLEETGALSYSENKINHLRDAILNEASRFGENKLLKEWLNENYTL